MIRRKEVLFGGLLTVIYGSCGCGRAGAQEASSGCWIPPDEVPAYFGRTSAAELFETGAEQMEPRSGNRNLDRALAQALATISREFEVLPAFSYYDDAGAPNAKATPEKLLDRADGTVLFGTSLLQTLLERSRPDASIIAVCAHEFGHIVSYKNGMISQLNPNRGEPFRGEQFADFMAGFFAGRRKLQHPDYPAASFAATQNSFGGGDHGTADQRGNAVQAGFLAAYQKKLAPRNAPDAALQYALAQNL